MADDAVLILSELISNSCRHARPLGDGEGAGSVTGTGGSGWATEGRAVTQVPAGRTASVVGIRAAWSIEDDGLLVLEVTDGGGPTRPQPASPSLSARGGRGLGIVGSLALRWGVRDAPGEVTVWALLAVRGRHARREDAMGTGIGLPRGVPLGLPMDLAESLKDLA